MTEDDGRARGSPQPGDALDPTTTLTELIGRGGMGSVWLARSATLDAEVVVKLLAPELSASSSMRERLLREARAAARVQSTHAVKVYDARTSDRFGPYLVMERLDGESLQARLDRCGALSVDEIRRVVAEVAHALDDAHRQRVIHRDIKPGNIFLARTASAPFVVKVLDFGIARIENDTITEAGHVIGTPAYMSPEQLLGERVDGRSDLYALALVFYRCVSGAPAISAASIRALGIGAYRLPLPSPRAQVPSLPAAIDDWFARATAFRPEARFPTGEAMAKALAEALGGASTPAPGEAPRPAEITAASERGSTVASVDEGADRPGRGSSGRLRAWALAGAALVAAASGALAYANRSERGAAPPDASPVVPALNDGAAGAPPDLRIGVLVDLGSSNRERGRAIRAAIGAAEGLFDSHGGVRGRALRFSFVDDRGATDAALLRTSLEAARAASTLPIVIGPTTSDQLVATLPWLASTETLAFSASATLALRDARFLVRTAPSDAQAAVALAALMATPPNRCGKVAIVRSADAYAESYEKALSAALEARGMAVVRTPPVASLPEKSYATSLDAVAAANASCEVLVVPAPVGARYLLEAAPRSRRSIRTFASDSLAGEDFIALSRGARQDVDARSVAEGTMGVRARRSTEGRTERRFFERLLAGRDAGRAADETFAASAFDAAMLAGLAIEKVGPDADVAAYRAAIIALSREGATYGPQDLDELLLAIRQSRDVDYQGASGSVDMNDEGEIRADFEPWVIRDGRIVERNKETDAQ